MSSPSRLQAAIERIHFARHYTAHLIDGLSDAEWFWHPAELTTHVAWQVGHLAVAQYNLCLRRIRGRIEPDEPLISDPFLAAFQLGSTPLADPAQNLPLDEIRRVFHAVHEQSLTELAGRTDEELQTPVERPHPVFTTKIGAVEWCSAHEMVHAGQIGLLRRMMGKPPIR